MAGTEQTEDQSNLFTLDTDTTTETTVTESDSSKQLDDVVNSPAHYADTKIECLDYIRETLSKEEYVGYLRGNIWKYLHRWRKKNGTEDLYKARFYLDELIVMGGKL